MGALKEELHSSCSLPNLLNLSTELAPKPYGSLTYTKTERFVAADSYTDLQKTQLLFQNILSDSRNLSKS